MSSLQIFILATSFYCLAGGLILNYALTHPVLFSKSLFNMHIPRRINISLRSVLQSLVT